MHVPTQATFLQALADGRWRLKSPDGLPSNLYGRAPVPASHFPRLAKGLEQTTLDIFGQTSSASSASAVLQSSLENRLHQAMAAPGSPEYALTWKQWDMPSGPPICALRASAPRTSGKGSTGALKGWTTPQAHDTTGRSKSQKAKHGTAHGCACLVNDAALAGWATPRANDGEKRGDVADNPRNGLVTGANLAGWPTPTSKQAAGGEYADPEKAIQRAMGPHANDLRDFVRLATTGSYAILADAGGWPTAVMIDGVACRLNPRFSLWLMGYPDEWAFSGEQAMQSTRG